MRTAILSILSWTLPAFAQQGAALAFEVATVKASRTVLLEDLVLQKIRTGFTVDGAQFTARAVSMSSLILRAYNLQTFQLTSPDWTRTQPYIDIVAKIPEGAAKEQAPEMLQALLKARFKLSVHRETKPLDAFALVVAKGGPKLKEAAPGAPPMFNMTQPSKGVFRFQITCTMDSFAQTLATYVRRPVVDRTNLKGVYEITMDVTRDTQGEPQTPGEEFVSAVEQPGLKLESRKEPVEMLVVDHIEKTPTEN